VLSALCVVLDADLVDPKDRPAAPPNHEAAKLVVLARHPKLARLPVSLKARRWQEADFLVVLLGQGR
jgi:hypothetical protein